MSPRIKKVNKKDKNMNSMTLTAPNSTGGFNIYVPSKSGAVGNTHKDTQPNSRFT